MSMMIGSMKQESSLSLFTKLTLLAFCSVPFFAIIYVMNTDTLSEHMNGIVWSAIAGE
jgi:hypothetical protein